MTSATWYARGNDLLSKRSRLAESLGNSVRSRPRTIGIIPRARCQNNGHRIIITQLFERSDDFSDGVPAKCVFLFRAVEYDLSNCIMPFDKNVLIIHSHPLSYAALMEPSNGLLVIAKPG